MRRTPAARFLILALFITLAMLGVPAAPGVFSRDRARENVQVELVVGLDAEVLHRG